MPFWEVKLILHIAKSRTWVDYHRHVHICLRSASTCRPPIHQIGVLVLLPPETCHLQFEADRFKIRAASALTHKDVDLAKPKQTTCHTCKISPLTRPDPDCPMHLWAQADRLKYFSFGPEVPMRHPRAE